MGVCCDVSAHVHYRDRVFVHPQDAGAVPMDFNTPVPEGDNHVVGRLQLKRVSAYVDGVAGAEAGVARQGRQVLDAVEGEVEFPQLDKPRQGTDVDDGVVLQVEGDEGRQPGKGRDVDHVVVGEPQFGEGAH